MELASARSVLTDHHCYIIVRGRRGSYGSDVRASSRLGGMRPDIFVQSIIVSDEQEDTPRITRMRIVDVPLALCLCGS